jgi:hypothetical protein
MFGFLKKLFGGEPEAKPAETAPYKVELMPTEIVEGETRTVPVAKPAPAKKPATKKAPVKKEGTKKPAGNRGRKPKAK